MPCKSQRSSHRTTEKAVWIFGVRYGHLPFRTANGDYEPTVSVTRRSTVVDLQRYCRSLHTSRSARESYAS